MYPLLIGALMFAAGIAAHRKFIRARADRVDPEGLADHLQWAFNPAPGVFLLKDGALMVGWRYRGPDRTTASNALRNQVARVVNRVKVAFGEGWMFHWDLVRRPAVGYAPPGAFPDGVTWVIDEEPRARFGSGTHYENECFVVVTGLPARDVVGRWTDWFMEGVLRLDNGHARLKRFLRDVERIERMLGAALTMERLGSDELMTHCHRCLSGLDHPVAAPPDGAYLDAEVEHEFHTRYVNIALGSKRVVTGHRPVVGRLHTRVVSIHGFPNPSLPGCLDALGELPASYRWSTRWICVDSAKASRVIKRDRRMWMRHRGGMASAMSSKPAGPKTAKREADEAVFEDDDAMAMAVSSKNALEILASGAASFGHVTPCIVVQEPTAERADEVALMVETALGNLRFAANTDDVNTWDAVLGTLPGHGYPNVWRPKVSSAYAARMLPLGTPWAGPATHPSKLFPTGSPATLWTDGGGVGDARVAGGGASATPFRLTLAHNQVQHALVLGETGGGKSTLLQAVSAAFFRYPDAEVHVIDRGNSFELLCRAAGGNHFELSPRADGTWLQPFAYVDDPLELAAGLQLARTVAGLQGVGMNPGRQVAIEDAMRLIAGLEPDERTFSSLAYLVQDEALRVAFRCYTLDGVAPFMDGKADGLRRGHGRFNVYETERLMDDLGPAYAGPALMTVLNRIERRLDGARPVIVVIEEAWKTFLEPWLLEWTEARLRTWRKKNAGLILVSTGFSEFDALPNKQVILDQCRTRILLPNAAALDPEVKPAYRRLQLNDSEIEAVRDLGQFEYYFKNPAGGRKFSLSLGPVALAFFTPREGGMGATMAAARALEEEHGDRWTAEWLRQCAERCGPRDPHRAALHAAARQLDAYIEGEHGAHQGHLETRGVFSGGAYARA
ncbi:MAG: hypothetical protein AB1941_25760 [Gemmatimonadota bacterium]